MHRNLPPTDREASERAALRRRVLQMYRWVNASLWDKCFALLDPRLRAGNRIDPATYGDLLRAFRDYHGAISPWYVRINLHLDAPGNGRDGRPFAYVYTVWQDDRRNFQMFRERWVKDAQHWYSRVVGLVPNAAAARGRE
jgi:hypothetical protein